MLELTRAFASFPVLETERLTLRAATPDDAVDMFRIMGDPQVTRYFGQLQMASLDAAAKRIEGFALAFAEQSGVRWAISARADGQLIGSCGYWRLLKEHLRAEVGYELAPAWWGRGVMPEALEAVLRFGFADMGLHSVEAQIHPANNGSRRVLEKLGFVQEGHFHENFYDPVEQGFTDTAVFSLLRAAWAARAGAGSGGR